MLLLFSLFYALITPALAQDDTTIVSLDTTDAPASDLVYQGKPVDQDQAVQLRKKGVDLSALDPVPNDSYGSQQNTNPMPMPADGATLDYDSSLAGFGQELSIHRVVHGPYAYHLDISTIPHRALLTRALLAKLGYNQYAPKRYERLTLRFKSMMDRASFLDTISLNTIKDPSTWVVSMPANQPEVTLQDVLLEPGRVDLQNFYWATLPSGFSEGRRALRAMLVPLSLCDAPENIDSYHWTFGYILSNSLVIAYPHEIDQQHPFDDSTIDDVKWIAKKVAALSANDWKAIVDQAQYPADIGQLVLQKIIAKRDQMVGFLQLNAPKLAYDAHLNNSSVQNGEVDQAHFDGWASRFSYGDAEDPLNTTEMLNMGILDSISAGMQSLATYINSKMVVQGVGDIASKHTVDLINQMIQFMNNHPNQPYVQPIQSWGGPTGNFSVTANRSVTTGTFYGSNAAIQLVDQIGVTATAGYFRGLDGLKKIIPGLQGQVGFSRSYAHLKPLMSIGDAFKVSPTDFAVPALLYDLSKILTPADPKASAAQQSKQLADYTQAVEDFLSKLNDGEMFTVTDSIAAGASLQIQIPIQALFPSLPVGYNQGISFGPGIQGAILRRTTFRRVNDVTTGDNYLQIYVQSMNTETGNITLDFNYWINILHAEKDFSHAHAKTRVYTIKSDSGRDQGQAKVLATSMQSLLAWNSDSDLEKNYPFYLLDHELGEDDWKWQFLFFVGNDMESDHELTIQPPKDDQHSYNPADYQRDFYSYRTYHLTGLNFMSMLSSILGSLTQGQGTANFGSGENPAYTLYGSAHWTEMYTDAELSKGKDFIPVTVARETWGGWSISHDHLFEIFDKLDEQLSGLQELGVNISPIHRDVFAATDELEFYNIQEMTVFYPTGVQRLLDPLDPKPDGSYSPNFMERWDSDNLSSSDRQVFDTLVEWYGGKQAYRQMCVDEAAKMSSGMTPDDPPMTAAVVHGVEYDCIDHWAKSVLDMRRKKASSSDPKGEIKWQSQMIELLGQKIPLKQIAKVAQKDGFFLQIKVTGFRKGDHEAKDSEQSEIVTAYVSDTVGTADQLAGVGALAALADQTKIVPYEINAYFATGGE